MTVKLALLKSGEDVIADWHEMVVDERVIGYLAKYPYTVSIEDAGESDDTKVGLKFFPWMPYQRTKRFQ